MFTKTFKQISKKDVLIAGGKGASLGKLTKTKSLFLQVLLSWQKRLTGLK